ncbi:MAG: hypothetical protein KBE53_04760 [Chromatiaceae bacterium]|nr:hypothetical protein [Chromatiaceae bacterium]
MLGLASFIMRGRSQAALVAAVFAILSLLFPLTGMLSSATLALATLRQGPVEGLLVGLFAGLASGLFAFAALGSPMPALGFALALWLPVWALAVMLRNSGSPALTVTTAGLMGLAILIGLKVGVADPAAYWAELLEPVRKGLIEGGILTDAESQALILEVARWMTGAFAATFYFQALLALFLGRWWQSLLYNPGGFGAEFRDLRLGKGLGVLGLALMAFILVKGENQWAADLLILITPLFLLQGLALIHWLVKAMQANRGWLIGLYALFLLALPHAQVLTAGLGLADIWVNVRAKVRPRQAEKN